VAFTGLSKVLGQTHDCVFLFSAVGFTVVIDIVHCAAADG